jgi:hypothetical protein
MTIRAKHNIEQVFCLHDRGHPCGCGGTKASASVAVTWSNIYLCSWFTTTVAPLSFHISFHNQEYDDSNTNFANDTTEGLRFMNTLNVMLSAIERALIAPEPSLD